MSKRKHDYTWNPIAMPEDAACSMDSYGGGFFAHVVDSGRLGVKCAEGRTIKEVRVEPEYTVAAWDGGYI
jgi:hypothetical protein